VMARNLSRAGFCTVAARPLRTQGRKVYSPSWISSGA
jgi:hypothetical protein